MVADGYTRDVGRETKTSLRNLTTSELRRRKGRAMSMMKNKDVLSFGFDEYLVVPMELTSESRKNERNESCNKRLVEFDEWQDETDAMLCGDENERNMVRTRDLNVCGRIYIRICIKNLSFLSITSS